MLSIFLSPLSPLSSPPLPIVDTLTRPPSKAARTFHFLARCTTGKVSWFAQYISTVSWQGRATSPQILKFRPPRFDNNWITKNTLSHKKKGPVPSFTPKGVGAGSTAANQAQDHAPLSAADQRKSRAVRANVAARIGVRVALLLEPGAPNHVS